MKKIIAVLICLLLLTAAGCSKKETSAPAAQAPAQVTVTEAPIPTAVTEAPAEDAGYAFSFTALTLDGESVTEEVFGRYDLTMVNVWASWCGPCRGELAELGELYGRLPANVGFLSVTVDDAQDLDDARALLRENGCAFPCLDGLTSEGLVNGFIGDVMAIPTTIFFDRSGNQVGEWIVGVPQGSGSVADAYLAEIEARLDLMGK